MINTKDLRIGNYVTEKKHGFNNDTNPFQIFSIYHEDNNSKINGLSINNFEPIKLTQEWLLKFGFSDNDYKKGYIGKDFKSGGMILDFVLSKPFSKGEWNNTYTFDFEGHRFSKMEFVHELQNFYYCLTGVMLSLS